MRVLLIGGSGFIGQRVVESLQKRGHEVIIFHRGHTRTLAHIDAERIVGNRLEIDKHIAEIERVRPDVAVDFLPWNDRDTSLVVKTLNGRAKRVVHLSSGDVYRAWGHFLNNTYGEPLPISEDAPLRDKMYPYAGTQPGMEDYEKILAERAVFTANYRDGYPGVILRLPVMYGPGEVHYRSWEFVKRMLDKRPAILLDPARGAWLWQRGYVEDIAYGIALTLERENATGQVYNIGNLQTVTMATWVRAIGDVLSWQGDIVFVPRGNLPTHLQSPYTYAQHIIYDTSKIRRDVGYYELLDPAVSLQRTIKWMVDNPPPDDRADYKTLFAEEDRLLKTLAAL